MERLKTVPKALKELGRAVYPDYSGRKYAVEFKEAMSMYDTNWSGGTRNYYRAVMFDGSSFKVANMPVGTWYNPNDVENRPVAIPENGVVVEHSFFCGHDMGLRFYFNPAAQALFPMNQKQLTA